MFSRKKEGSPQARIDSLIGAGLRLEGNLHFSSGLRIDGVVAGNVQAVEGASSSTLVLSEHARVEGAISVAHLVMNGTVVGPVVVSGTLEMQSKARILGDVSYASIEMQQGAVIVGRLTHLPNGPVSMESTGSDLDGL